MAKDKIIILTNSNFPFGGPSSNYIRNLSLGLRLHTKQHINVWLQSGNSRPDKEFSGQRNGNFKGIHYTYIGGYVKRPNSLIGKIANNLYGAITPFFHIILNSRRIDKVLFYNHTTYSCILPFLICKLLKIKTIKIIPEWYEKTSVVTSKLKLIKWHDYIFGMKVLNFQFDGLIVLSTFLRNYYRNGGYKDDKISILPNLVDIEQFHNKNNNIDNSFTIGYSGSPVKKDGILILLKAFGILLKDYPNESLLIIGDISKSKSAIPFLMNKAIEYGIPKESICFTGLLDFNEVPKWLDKCQILTLARPSGIFAEAGFPTKLGEYLASKKPTVLTKVGDIPLYFTNKVNAILVEPDNPISLYNGFKFLIENPGSIVTISNKGFDWVRKNIEYKTATKRIASFIDML